MSNETPLVGIILGSKSDLPAMEGCTEMLEKFGVPYELWSTAPTATPSRLPPGLRAPKSAASR